MPKLPAPEATPTIETRASRPAKFRRLFFIIMALCLLGGVVFFLALAEDTADVEAVTTPPPLQLVTVDVVTPRSQTAKITAHGEVRPRWSVELRAAVSGQITAIKEGALAGGQVIKGAPLVDIENSRYVADVAAAELAIKEARLALWKAENATLVARAQYKRSGKKPPNDLALHLPQLDIAKASVKSTTAKLAAARRQLEDASVTAPFSGFITERFVSLGQTVSIDAPLVKLVDETVFEVTLELGRKDWALLKQPVSGQKARLFSQTGIFIAPAIIRHGGGFLDEKTRQYKIFLEVSNPTPGPLLSGDFVRVELPGKTIPAALEVSATALTQEGYLWYVDQEDRLRRLTPTILFRRQDRIILTLPENASAWRFATTPLKSFLPGQKVQTRLKEE
ncbi:MAG: efflux RND transporter periplasmic adaptor subunit [Sneathiella sp.]